MLKEEGAVPVPVADLSAAEMPIAAYEWQLKAWEFEPTGVELPEEPTQQSYGLDFGFRDPFGNQIRIGKRSDLD